MSVRPGKEPQQQQVHRHAAIHHLCRGSVHDRFHTHTHPPCSRHNHPSVYLQQQVCIQSVTVVLDEDVSRQITLTREGEVIIGVNPVPVLPYVDGRKSQKLFEKNTGSCYNSNACWITLK